MKLERTRLHEVLLVDLDRFDDERGWFMRTFAVDEFADAGLSRHFPHHNLTLTRRRGTLRGLHYQVPPRAEVKVVHCLQGAVHDVLVDVRPGSPSHRQWEAFVLDGPGTVLYVPAGLAHGYQTLTDDVVIAYLMGQTYSPQHERGIRWDDPAVGIEWPLEAVVSPKDAGHRDVDWEAAWPAS